MISLSAYSSPVVQCKRNGFYRFILFFIIKKKPHEHEWSPRLNDVCVCSRNQLGSLPACLCGLPLRVLNASNNKLVSLPETIGQLQSLMELVRLFYHLCHCVGLFLWHSGVSNNISIFFASLSVCEYLTLQLCCSLLLSQSGEDLWLMFLALLQ